MIKQCRHLLDKYTKTDDGQLAVCRILLS